MVDTKSLHGSASPRRLLVGGAGTAKDTGWRWVLKPHICRGCGSALKRAQIHVCYR